jgi:uncharacterized membrane-anchored protein YhcB (DUF1043 family)
VFHVKHCYNPHITTGAQKMAITTADIHAAADALTAAGKKPTLAAIRTALGTGSYSTIGEAMKNWEKTAAPQAPAATTPQAVTDKAAELAAQVWAIAQELAEQQMQAAREEIEKQRQAMEAQRVEAVELADALAAELEELRKTAAVQAAKLESMADRIAHAEKQAEAARTAEIEAREAAAELRGKLEASKAPKTKRTGTQPPLSL